MENDGYIELKIKVATANNGTIIIVNQENGIGLYVDADGLYSEWFNFLTKKIALAKAETSESNAILPDVRKRAIAMAWWNAFGGLSKTRLCDTHTEIVGSVRRHETLTGFEIQKLYDAEHVF